MMFFSKPLLCICFIPVASSASPIKILRSTEVAPGAGSQTFEGFIPIGFDNENNFYFRGPGRDTNNSGIWKLVPSASPVPELVISQGDAGPAAEGVTAYSVFVGSSGLALDGTLGAFTIIDSGSRATLVGSGATDSYQLALTEVPATTPLTSSTYHSVDRISIEDAGFLAAVTKNLNAPFAHSITSGAPGALTIDVTDGDPSPSGSPFGAITGHSLVTAANRSYSFTARLENDLLGLFLKKVDSPLQTLLLEGSNAPGTGLDLEGVFAHSRSPGGYIAVAVTTPDPDPGPFPTPVDRVLIGTEGSFMELSADHLLPGTEIRGRDFAELTAFDTGAFFNYSYSYFVDDKLTFQKALVRSSGLVPEIEIIAQSGQAAPGFPEGTTFDSSRQFIPTSSPRSDGTVAFTARVTDGATNHFATYLSRPGDPLELIGKFGDTYEFDPGVTTTIQQIGFGTDLAGFPVSRISPDGSVMYVVTLKNPSPGGPDIFDVYIDYTTPPGSGGGQTYAEWAAANGVGAAIEDDDKDEVVNLLEFLLAGDASDPSDAPLPEISQGLVRLTRNSAVNDATLILEASTDMVTWSTSLLTLDETVPGPDDTEVLSYTVPAGVSAVYVRVRGTIVD